MAISKVDCTMCIPTMAKVYCDQKTAGGGWTVFQRRKDGSVDFYRGWVDYKNGFGDLNGEFWLGLDKIHRLTQAKRNRLRVEIEDTKGNSTYAEYDFFDVTNEQSKYNLSIGTYSGTAGDSLSYHRYMTFTTKDRDNDKCGGSCAVGCKGAWWYNCCHHSNLNGQYKYNGTSSVTESWWRSYRVEVEWLQGRGGGATGFLQYNYRFTVTRRLEEEDGQSFREEDGSVDFYRGWADYKKGFGDLKGEFWLGLDKIHRLTHQTRNRLRVEIENTKGKSAYSEYDFFDVTSERSKYKLGLGTYSVCEKQKFSTEGSKSKFCLINRIAEELKKELTKASDDDKPKFLHDLIKFVADIPPPLEKTAASKVKEEEKIKQEGVFFVDSTSVLRRQFKLIGQIGEAEQKDKFTYNSLVRQIKSVLGQGYPISYPAPFSLLLRMLEEKQELSCFSSSMRSKRDKGAGFTVTRRLEEEDGQSFREEDGSVDFYRGWADYKKGFGDLKGEFWLGLDKIHRLTHQTRNRLRVEIENTKGKSAYSEYDFFDVTSERSKYKLGLGTYSGTAGDSLSYHRNVAFSTKDRDNDKADHNCAVRHSGAWWYNCYYSSLNGAYNYRGTISDRGVTWYHWKNMKKMRL
ncbi:Ficolin-1 [Exaiptasia diaphana]|nr:Ficolin-1 [Exaiptasia diaphana]